MRGGWITLAELMPGQKGVVCRIGLDGPFAARLADLGLVPGTELRCRLRAPWGSPLAYELRGAVIALRKADAAQILCRREDEN